MQVREADCLITGWRRLCANYFDNWPRVTSSPVDCELFMGVIERLWRVRPLAGVAVSVDDLIIIGSCGLVVILGAAALVVLGY